MANFWTALESIAGHGHTFLIYNKGAQIISSRSLHVTRNTSTCLPSMQSATWAEAWERYDAMARDCNVKLDPRVYVAVRGDKTGIINKRGAEVLRMHYADAIPVFGPTIRRTRSGAWLLRGRSTRRYSTYELARKSYDREVDRINAVCAA
jgi:hypothetical protein